MLHHFYLTHNALITPKLHIKLVRHFLFSETVMKKIILLSCSIFLSLILLPNSYAEASPNSYCNNNPNCHLLCDLIHSHNKYQWELHHAIYNNEKETYHKHNVIYQQDLDKVDIQADRTADRTHYDSGFISSKQFLTTGHIRHGFFEAEVKLPAVHGTWPAIWMLPKDKHLNGDQGAASGWPINGEIDILEWWHFFNDTTFKTTLHGSSKKNDDHSGFGYAFKTPSSLSNFHYIGLEWDIASDYKSGTLSIYIDGKKQNQTFNLNYYHSDREKQILNGFNPKIGKGYYFIFNLAMGGNLGGSLASTPDHLQINIKHIKLYSLTSSPDQCQQPNKNDFSLWIQSDKTLQIQLNKQQAGQYNQMEVRDWQGNPLPIKYDDHLTNAPGANFVDITTQAAVAGGQKVFSYWIYPICNGARQKDLGVKVST